MNNIILFDGVCNFCNSSVNYVIRHDPKKKFRFSPLQSDAGESLQKQFNLEINKAESVVLIYNNKVLTRSTAALYIAKQLSGITPLLFAFIIVPRPIRDWVYNYIAKNRYKWFGKKDSCMIPTSDVRSRFLIS